MSRQENTILWFWSNDLEHVYGGDETHNRLVCKSKSMIYDHEIATPWK